MAYKIFNIIALFLIVGTIIASPVDRPTENVKNSLLKSVLDSMNNGHSNHSFLNGTLLNVEKILAEKKKKKKKKKHNDPIIKDFVNTGIDKLGEYKPPGKPLVTSMVNATKEDIPDGTKYVIYFVIIDPTCVTSGISTTCSTQDDSLARLCTVIVEEKHQLKYTVRHFDATCEKEQYPLDTLI
uniref:Venom protein Ci-28 n=1 Tax=Chelonus inanitus TaxID=49201 RepID=E6ZCJ5_9HYME|nr:venom protein Ci-28 [Chelonus inanitus]